MVMEKSWKNIWSSLGTHIQCRDAARIKLVSAAEWLFEGAAGH